MPPSSGMTTAFQHHPWCITTVYNSFIFFFFSIKFLRVIVQCCSICIPRMWMVICNWSPILDKTLWAYFHMVQQTCNHDIVVHIIHMFKSCISRVSSGTMIVNNLSLSLSLSLIYQHFELLNVLMYDSFYSSDWWWLISELDLIKVSASHLPQRKKMERHERREGREKRMHYKRQLWES